MKFILNLREPFSAASHLVGAAAGIIGGAYLLSCCDGNQSSIIAILIYSFALILLFLVSGLFHGLHVSMKTIAKLERLDYAAIYFFIAGTYTPICVFAIKGWLGVHLLITEWTLAFIGAYFALTRGPSNRGIQVIIYLIMGWAFVLALPSLSSALHPLALNLLLCGGVIYSVGAIIFILNRPKLFCNRYTAHDCWHALVLLGSTAHYIAILQLMS